MINYQNGWRATRAENFGGYFAFKMRAREARPKKIGGILPRSGTNNKNHLIVKDPRGTNNKTHLAKNSSNLGFFELKGGVYY